MSRAAASRKAHHADAGTSGRSGNCDDRVAASAWASLQTALRRGRGRRIAATAARGGRRIASAGSPISRTIAPGASGRGGRIGSGSGISMGRTTTCRNGPVPVLSLRMSVSLRRLKMNDAALAAVHRVEVKGPARLLHLLGGGDRAQTQLLDPQHAVVVGVEAQSANDARAACAALPWSEIPAPAALPLYWPAADPRPGPRISPASRDLRDRDAGAGPPEFRTRRRGPCRRIPCPGNPRCCGPVRRRCTSSRPPFLNL